MAKLREYGLRGPTGSAFVVDENRTDRAGRPIPIVCVDFDLDARRVTWNRVRRAAQPEDSSWEQTDWAGACEALRRASVNPDDVAGYRQAYIELFTRLADAGLIGTESIAFL
jgi:hypothetical protein